MCIKLWPFLYQGLLKQSRIYGKYKELQQSRIYGKYKELHHSFLGGIIAPLYHNLNVISGTNAITVRM